MLNSTYPPIEAIWEEFDSLKNESLDFPASLDYTDSVQIGWSYGLTPIQVEEEYELFLNWIDNEA